jgi:MIP family channel proteins
MAQPQLHPTKRQPWQRYLAEFIGTFAIVFAACGAVISNRASDDTVGLLGIALTPGLMVLAMIYALGPICSAHFNPAVTIAFAVARRFSWRHVPAYVATQVAGALFAAVLLQVLYGRDVAMQVSFGAHIPRVPVPQAIGFEIVFGFFLMLVIIAVATDKRVPGPVPGLAIGMTVALAIMIGGPMSGASMNPARSLGPALLAGGEALAYLPIYLIAPTAGAIVAALTYEALRDGQEFAQSAPPDFV